jgi:YD repeat-containing protein
MNTIGRIFIFGMILLMIRPAFGQRLNEKVKSYRYSYYSVREKFGKIQKGHKLNDSVFLDQYVTFDQNGNITEEIEYNYDGTIHARYKAKFGYEDNNIESIYVKLDPQLVIDKKPFIMESVKYSWGEKYEMSYINDTKGRPVEETIYDLFGRELYKIKIQRDEKGHPVEDDFSDGSVDQYKYDEKGNLIEWVFRSSNSNVIITSYKYNDHGNVTEMNVNNFFKSTYKFHYDHHTYVYQYDASGNWIERLEYENDKPQRIVERTIEYSF